MRHHVDEDVFEACGNGLHAAAGAETGGDRLLKSGLVTGARVQNRAEHDRLLHTGCFSELRLKL